ncbi:hypothetical protein KXX39_007404 [Aspergillus fumigatus]|nr:hypothetical protein KXX39_007404 [Aspergillus fumigatus]
MKLTSIAVALFLSLSATAMPVADAEGDNAATPLPIADVEADTAAAIPVANVEADTPTTETPVAEIEVDNADIEEDTPDVEGDAPAALEARRVKCRFKKIGWKNVRCFYQGGDWSHSWFEISAKLPSMPRILSSLRAISRTSLLAKGAVFDMPRTVHRTRPHWEKVIGYGQGSQGYSFFVLFNIDLALQTRLPSYCSIILA